MKHFIIKKLKEYSCVKGKQKTWISECTDDQLYHIFRRLKNGESAKAIARYVKRKWDIHAESSVHSLSQGILKFKARIKDMLEPDPVDNKPARTKKKDATPVDSIEAIELIAIKQKRRIIKMMTEERSGIIHPNLTKDVQALAALSKTILKHKEFEVKHADQIRHIEEEKRKAFIKDNFDSLMSNTTDEQRRQMVENLRCLSEQLREIERSWPKFIDLKRGHVIIISPEDAKKYLGKGDWEKFYNDEVMENDL